MKIEISPRRNKKRVLFVFGTRPEAIKMAPVIRAFLKDGSFKIIICATGQHREMLAQAVGVFGVTIHKNLSIMAKDQTLAYITATAISELTDLYERENPDMVMVQGDTTTAMAAAMAAFYMGIPIAHIEAGLRSFDLGHPFPEELNRVVIDKISALRFAPTNHSAKQLIKEGCCPASIIVTGNTSVDALLGMAKKPHEFVNSRLSEFFKGFFLDRERKIILLTAHRRENFGLPLEEICRGVLSLCRRYPRIVVFYPVHLNPNVQKIARRYLQGHDQIILTDPLDYGDLVALMRRSHIILTDSGGIQEEAPTFGIPVLVLRKTTERVEAIQAGCARLIGELTQGNLVREASRLLSNGGHYRRVARRGNPFGDGKASGRILAATKSYFK